MAQLGPCRKNDHHRRAKHHRTGSQIRLHHDQPEGQSNQTERREQAFAKRRNVEVLAAQPLGQEQNHPELHKFGGLNAEGADPEPAPCTPAHNADARNQDDDEQPEADDQSRLGVFFPYMVVQICGKKHRDQSESGKQHLSLDEIE
ncbi:hypothetical protein BGX30_008034 [Mortierella sp. GBA39]|nr:hypothetical protein BGX30_008034 [Mortierella sp. GBA39]